MIEGKTPLVHLALEELNARAQSGYENWRDFHGKVLPIYADLVPLMRRCLCYNPVDRPSTADLVRELRRISYDTFQRKNRRAFLSKRNPCSRSNLVLE